MKSAWFIYAVVGLQAGAAGSYAIQGRFKLAAYWLLISACNSIAATF
jgi:hypothetical protein